MVAIGDKNVEYLVVDTTAFIQNAPLQNVGRHIMTCQEVVDEITSKRQLRRLVVLPYDLDIKNVYPENIQVITEFAKKTGDYSSLSATDIKVMALTYQLEKEHVGIEHLHKEPVIRRTVNVITTKRQPDMTADVTGFYLPSKHKADSGKTSRTNSTNEESVPGDENDSENRIDIEQLDKVLTEKFKSLTSTEAEDLEVEEGVDNILISVEKNADLEETGNVASDQIGASDSDGDFDDEDDDDDDDGWITPSNVQKAKKQVNSELVEEKSVKVACMTTDFAMQNVLKQMNLSVAALDGRIIKQLRTFILRCYACFGTTSIMTKLFCPKCGNNTLKRVAVSLDEDGKQQIHINGRRPLTGRGKKFSLPRIRGGKHSNNPRLVEDQPMPDQRPTRLARTKNNPLDCDYIAGFSPFVMRDVTSKSAQLKIRPSTEVKHWMRRNPNEAARLRKK